MNNVISEYKLLGYYLLKLYETNGNDSIKYEQVKSLTNNVFNRLVGNPNQGYTPLNAKKDIINSMIKKNIFKVNNINGKQSFTQIYNYEVSKYILAVYSCDGYLTFKLPKEIKEGDEIMLNAMRKIYTNGISLQLKSSLDSEIKNFIQKIYTKNKNYA